jgi:hypothetical protein
MDTLPYYFLLLVFIASLSFLFVNEAHGCRMFVRDEEAAANPAIIVVTGQVSRVEVKATDTLKEWYDAGVFYEIQVDEIVKGDGVKVADRLLIYDRNHNTTAMTNYESIKRGVAFLKIDTKKTPDREYFKMVQPWYVSLKEYSLDNERGQQDLENL